MTDDRFKGIDAHLLSIEEPGPDLAIEGATLSEVLTVYPETMTRKELIRQLTSGPGDFAEQDSIKRAVRDLVASGLLHRHGAFVIPTRAAVKFWSLKYV
jgi:hypothetical protein